MIRIVAMVASVCGGVAVALLAPGTAVAAPGPPGPGCSRIELITVRGSTEPQGDGGSVAGPVAAAVRSRLPGQVAVHDLPYPALLQPRYRASEQEGVRTLAARLRAVSASCPSTTFVLVGYSQGAQVIADVLDAEPVPGASRITAVDLYGDPSFNSAEPYDIGGFTRGVNGIMPRPTGALAAFASRISSHCHADDTVCQAGATGSGHFTYSRDIQAGVGAVLARLERVAPDPQAPPGATTSPRHSPAPSPSPGRPRCGAGG